MRPSKIRLAEELSRFSRGALFEVRFFSLQSQTIRVLIEFDPGTARLRTLPSPKSA
jgi:hypothetical protein